MDKNFDHICDEVSRWETLEPMVHLEEESSGSGNRPEHTVQSLQRKYISLYGVHPKMEARAYETCGVCELVFNPRTAYSHKEQCPGKHRIQTQHIKKKVKNKKKFQNPSVPLPPLFKKEPQGPPVLSRFSEPSRISNEILPFLEGKININVTVTPKLLNETLEISKTRSPSPPILPQPLSPIILPDEESALSETGNSSNRHKKFKKSSKSNKEYDPDVHCGVMEGQRGPCTRSITCSNHKIQLRKSVPGRSKDIHLLIAEKKASKEKDTRRRSPSRPVSIEPKLSQDYDVYPLIDDDPLKCEETTEKEIIPNFLTSVRVPPLTNLSENDLHDDNDIDDSSNQLENGYCSLEKAVSSTKSSPVIYYNPISPIIVITPVQFIQKENNVFVEAPAPVPNGSYFLSIPEQSSNIKFYKSHPKPAILPSFGARKVGGSILSSNQRLEYQRNDIQVALSSKKKVTMATGCKTTSFNVPPQRSVLLKTKGITKVNCKRTATERLSVSDSKQIRLSDVNGFFVQTEVSEIADAPHSCIQENINLLNMK